MNVEKLFDYFGVSEHATEEEVKRRYRELVKKYHPDKNKSHDAKTKFQELKEAYEEILQIIKNKEVKSSEIEEESVEEQWRKYRERARKITLEKQKKQEDEMNEWYDILQSGLTWKYTKLVSICSGILVLILMIDLILPPIFKDDIVVAYNLKKYHTIDEHRISKVLTSKGDVYWLDRYNNGFFDLNPFVKVELTQLLHSPIRFQKFDGSSKFFIPIELTIYWAQLIIFIAFFISVGMFFYRKRDVFFIMGSYYTRYFMGPFILWFLISNNRWIHIFTLGFL